MGQEVMDGLVLGHVHDPVGHLVGVVSG